MEINCAQEYEFLYLFHCRHQCHQVSNSLTGSNLLLSLLSLTFFLIKFFWRYHTIKATMSLTLFKFASRTIIPTYNLTLLNSTLRGMDYSLSLRRSERPSEFYYLFSLTFYIYYIISLRKFQISVSLRLYK